MITALPPRFWAKVGDQADCWVWVGGRTSAGYGSFWSDGRARYAHVVAYESLIGAVSPGLELDHLCRNRACVNPAHLEPVTHQENMRRSERARRTHCRKGHPYDEANTRVIPAGTRECRTCHRLAEKARIERRRVDIDGERIEPTDGEVAA